MILNIVRAAIVVGLVSATVLPNEKSKHRKYVCFDDGYIPFTLPAVDKLTSDDWGNGNVVYYLRGRSFYTRFDGKWWRGFYTTRTRQLIPRHTYKVRLGICKDDRKPPAKNGKQSR